MHPAGAQQPDCVGWVRKVNRRWIVHHGLRESAEGYLDHLAETDPARLIRSCERARRLVNRCEAAEDPKPWFYAGLFSLATPGEAARFLADHWFTLSCIPGLAGGAETNAAPEPVSPETLEKQRRIRAAIQALADQESV